MADQVSRSAAKLAALIAVPLALLAGFGTFLLLGNAFAEPDPTTQPTPTETAPADPPPAEPVAMPARDLGEWDETVCRALLSQLPQELEGLPQRLVTEGPEQNAAYGEPPITVACGVEPVEIDPTDMVFPQDGVCWHAEEFPEQSVWTTLDREVPVQVHVPAAYDGPFQQVGALNQTITQTIRSADEAPAGC
ncbi:DUF3515 domain-containing protein [Natronosporangium hydrolyticum]|uniref:DUF3515 domain-containing protein n=1 Tax=Natronosporangium hydrolyticum TaxID=2811111 RepID=A0A895YIK1_9ACTN|nr:DUF3515 domain-containing protein [Natronosporangium hydrolyticum]QSB13588.1 DUF3515 domain-containing protein [Natronosporangium hydrolyticum]